MDVSTKETTITTVKLRQEELYEAIRAYLYINNIPNLDAHVVIDICTQSFADDGINGYDEKVAVIEIKKYR